MACLSDRRPESGHHPTKEIAMTDANVILVHGAFADGSSWNDVIERLEANNVSVKAVVNPLRGVASDAAYVRSVFDQTPGPVLAVGHSYGGAVVTNAAGNAANVKGLVYVSAFIPEDGETIQDIASRSKDSTLGPALQQTNYPIGTGPEMAAELTIDPMQYHDVFAGDLPEEQTAIMAANQRPLAASSFGEQTMGAAWKRLPSWAVVGSGDHTIGADVVREMAQRAGAKMVERDASHVVMVSQPDVVTDTIMNALRSLD